MQKLEVESDGVKHEIQYKTGLRKKLIVDDGTHKVKSSNTFVAIVASFIACTAIQVLIFFTDLFRRFIDKVNFILTFTVFFRCQ